VHICSHVTNSGLSITRTNTQLHTQTLSYTHKPSVTLTLSYTHKHSVTLTNIQLHSQTLSYTHKHSVTLTNTQLHSQTLSSPSLTLPDSHTQHECTNSTFHHERPNSEPIQTRDWGSSVDTTSKRTMFNYYFTTILNPYL